MSVAALTPKAVAHELLINYDGRLEVGRWEEEDEAKVRRECGYEGKELPEVSGEKNMSGEE